VGGQVGVKPIYCKT